ncbi:hypothetical protein HEMROJRC1_20460 [Rodentibacter sp. JRC1]|uniref:hypothetical protein n=1 Tax=Rodentibacter sp. JRC1 TaxID=2874504 RepID=UPI001CFE5DC4|nr:hypothetical protein [Rodentibacter sp. JRC1]GJI56934.1 hypothetical protein HEMROJRC1_20460 [Rodentibacter sp. JRC1]
MSNQEQLGKKEVICKFSLIILLGAALNPQEYFPQAKTYADVVNFAFDCNSVQAEDIFILDSFQEKLSAFLADLWIELGSDYYTLKKTKVFLQNSLISQGYEIQL